MHSWSWHIQLPLLRIGATQIAKRSPYRCLHLVRWERNGQNFIGVKNCNTLYRLPLNSQRQLSHSDQLGSYLSMYGYEGLMDAANRALETGISPVDLAGVKLLPIAQKPDKIIGIGLNYIDHCQELGLDPPAEPLIFSKFPSSLCSSGQQLSFRSDVIKKLDWEAELVIVIGKKAQHVKEDEALEYILGYTVANDITAREYVQLGPAGVKGSMLIAKSMDCFCPLSSILATKDCIDTNNLRITTKLNGKLVQDSNTKNLVFKPPQLIAYLSRYFTLLPGDLILTGTPPGVGAGMKPPRFLKTDDEVTVAVEGVGEVSNTITFSHT